MVREGNYRIIAYPYQVELWSVKRLSFDTKGWERLMRDELYAAIAVMYADPQKQLYAMYAAEDWGSFDLENVLTYNVGIGAFRNLKTDYLVLERSYQKPEVTRPELEFPCLQLYRFPMPEKDLDIQRNSRILGGSLSSSQRRVEA